MQVEVWNLIHSKRPKAENSSCRSSLKTPSSMLDTLKVLGGIGPLKAMVGCKAIMVERNMSVSLHLWEKLQSLRFFQGLGVRERIMVVFVRESGVVGVRKRERTVVFDRWCLRGREGNFEIEWKNKNGILNFNGLYMLIYICILIVLWMDHLDPLVIKGWGVNHLIFSWDCKLGGVYVIV